MKLSVICATHFPPRQVTALLNQVRPVAGEVVLAVDARLGAAQAARYAAAADRVLRYEYCHNAQHAMAWLHAQCRGEWVLRLDGDEVASPGLIAAIPHLVQRRDVLQYHIPRRWLFPDAGHWLNELPWFPDYQNRLVRNDGTLWFEGIAHSGAGAVLPCRYLEQPIYHLNLLTLGAADRIAKMEIYEARRAGVVAPGGGSVNRFYLPERYARMAPEAVPYDDQQAIRAVIHAPEPPDRAAGDLPLFERAEIDRWWNGRRPAPEAYRALLQPIERDHRMIAGEGRQIHLKITNIGEETWPWGNLQRPEIRVSYRWRQPDGAVLIAEGLRSGFPCSVRPKDQVIVPAAVIAPEKPGSYILEFDLVHELVRWFDCPLRIQMQVLAAPE